MNTYYAEGLLEYQKLTLDDFNSLKPISGKKILEVGGFHNYAVAYSLNNLSKEKITVINSDKNISFISDEKIEVLHVDGRNTPFEDGSFDTIIGVAVLEHILNMDDFAKEMFRILSPGGKLYMQGRPLWTCNVGHHIYFKNEEMDYKFNGNNPIEDFDHLFLTEEEMCEKLIAEKKLPSSHAEKIAEYVYRSPDLNRLALDKILSSFNILPFFDIKIKYNYARTNVPKNLDETNKINGVCIFAQK